jgi:ribosomal protein S27E
MTKPRKPRRTYPRVRCPGCGWTHALIDGRIWSHWIGGKLCIGCKMPLPHDYEI